MTDEKTTNGTWTPPPSEVPLPGALSGKSQTTGCAVRDPFKEVLDDLDEIADKLTKEGLNNLAVSALEAHRRLRNQSESIKQLQEKMHNDRAELPGK
jgi:hypothetical protein